MLATAALALGMTLVAAPAAHAADVTIPDTKLQAVVNQALNAQDGGTRADDDPVTEAEAELLTNLQALDEGIENLTGLEAFTNLTNLNLAKNNLSGSPGLIPIESLTKLLQLSLVDTRITGADLSGLSALSSLRVLSIGGATNDIDDLVPVSAFAGMMTLSIYNLNITDLSALSGMTFLNALYADGNHITDLTPLAGKSFDVLKLTGQTVDLPPVSIGTPVSNPLKDIYGSAVVPTSTDPDFAYDPVLNSWTFTTPGTKTITWSASVGGGTDNFAGTFTQEVTGTILPAPTVAQPQCTAGGSVTDPSITVPEVDGLEPYVFNVNGGEPMLALPGLQPGDKVEITAWPDTESGIILVAGNGWESGSDGELTYTVTINKAPTCTPDRDDPIPPPERDDPIPPPERDDPTPPETTDPTPPTPTETTTTDPTPSSTLTAASTPATTTSTKTIVPSATVADPPAGQNLATTGVDVITYSSIGLTLLLLGGGLLLFRRRSQARQH